MGLPFEGIKVADFSWVGVGPITMRYLADYGATVVRIESIQRPDFLRLAVPFRDGEPGIDRSGFFANYNGGKLGASLDLKHSKAWTSPSALSRGPTSWRRASPRGRSSGSASATTRPAR